MTELEKMMSGQIFNGMDESIDAIRIHATHALRALNSNIDESKRFELQKQLFGKAGLCIVQTPFHCEFGKTIEIGEETFINMNVVMLDGAKITIDNNVLIGPSAQFYTASHSMDYRSRRRWETFCKPITIEDDVWIG